MATASVNRPGSAQTTEKSQLILKGNRGIFPVSITTQNCSGCSHAARNVLKQDVQVFHRRRWGQIASFHNGWVEPVFLFFLIVFVIWRRSCLRFHCLYLFWSFTCICKALFASICNVLDVFTHEGGGVYWYLSAEIDYFWSFLCLFMFNLSPPQKFVCCRNKLT